MRQPDEFTEALALLRQLKARFDAMSPDARAEIVDEIAEVERFLERVDRELRDGDREAGSPAN